jgi:hypothetical protein
MAGRNPELPVRLFSGAVLIGAIVLAIGVVTVLTSYLSTGDDEVLQRLADALQKLALTIAVIAGGIWTLFTFSALHTRDLARSELATLQMQLERQATLRIGIRTEPFDFPGYSSYYVKVLVSVKNTGNRNTTLALNSSLLVAEVVPVGYDVAPLLHFASSPVGRGKIGAVSESPLTDAASAHAQPVAIEADYTLRVGMEIEVVYLIKLRGPGVYHAQFQTPLHPGEIQRMHEVGMKVDSAMWTADEVFCLPPVAGRAALGGQSAYDGSYPRTLEWCESSLRKVAAHLLTVDLDDPPSIPMQVLCMELSDGRRYLLFDQRSRGDITAVAQTLLDQGAAAGSIGIDVQGVMTALSADLESTQQATAVEPQSSM